MVNTYVSCCSLLFLCVHSCFFDTFFVLFFWSFTNFFSFAYCVCLEFLCQYERTVKGRDFEKTKSTFESSACEALTHLLIYRVVFGLQLVAESFHSLVLQRLQARHGIRNKELSLRSITHPDS